MNQKGFSPIILLTVIFTISLVLFGAVYLETKNNESKLVIQSNNTRTTASLTNQPITGWKTYEDFGITFRYPSDWTKVGSVLKSAKGLKIASLEKTSYQKAGFDCLGYLKEDVRSIQNQPKTSTSKAYDKFYYKVISIENVNINNFTDAARVVSQNPDDPSSYIIHYCISKGDFLYPILWFYPATLNSNEEDIFNQILSSFTLVNKSDSFTKYVEYKIPAEWKEQTNIYGVNIISPDYAPGYAGPSSGINIGISRDPSSENFSLNELQDLYINSGYKDAVITTLGNHQVVAYNDTGNKNYQFFVLPYPYYQILINIEYPNGPDPRNGSNPRNSSYDTAISSFLESIKFIQ